MPSPEINNIDDKDELAQMAIMYEQDIRTESGRVSERDVRWPPPYQYESPVPTRDYHGKTLSEISGSLSEAPELPDEWLDNRRAKTPSRSSSPPRSSTKPDIVGNKTKSGGEADCDEQEIAQQRVPKRKRGGDNESDRPQMAPQRAYKRLRRDKIVGQNNGWKLSDTKSKGKKNDAHRLNTPESPESTVRRRRLRSDADVAAAVPEQQTGLSPSSSSSGVAPITRARRRQMSGPNAKLYQLGQHGQVHVKEEQIPMGKAQAQRETYASNSTIDRSKGRCGGTIQMLPMAKASNNTSKKKNNSKKNYIRSYNSRTKH